MEQKKEIYFHEKEKELVCVIKIKKLSPDHIVDLLPCCRIPTDDNQGRPTIQ